MPINGYSVGRDVTLTLVTGSGPLNITGLTGWRKKQDSTEQRIKLLNGITDHVRFFDGWSGAVDVERQDSTLDNYFAQLETNYYAGINEQPVTFTETIAEPNGSITQWRFVNGLLKLDDDGDWRGDATVKIRLSWIAARRLKIA